MLLTTRGHSILPSRIFSYILKGCSSKNGGYLSIEHNQLLCEQIAVYKQLLAVYKRTKKRNSLLYVNTEYMYIPPLYVEILQAWHFSFAISHWCMTFDPSLTPLASRISVYPGPTSRPLYHDLCPGLSREQGTLVYHTECRYAYCGGRGGGGGEGREGKSSWYNAYKQKTNCVKIKSKTMLYKTAPKL